MKLHVRTIESPLGALLVATDHYDTVMALEFASYRARLQRRLQESYGDYTLEPVSSLATLVEDNLQRYCAGNLSALDEIAVAPAGAAFDREVWAALRRIPAGTTTTYGELAAQLSLRHAEAARDVGRAVGANPIAIIVPCHRVIGKDGDLKGYAWGLNRKRQLLAHEQADVGGDISQQRLAL